MTTNPQFSAKVYDEWSYTSTPPIYLHGVDRDILPLPLQKERGTNACQIGRV
jgi:hypothetical protein